MSFPNGVSLVYVESSEDANFLKFASELNEIGIETTVDSIPDRGPQACIEWMMPTAIMAGISASFLSEIGKDLFHQLKKQMANLTSETIKKPRIEPTMFGTKGKLSTENPYSSAFSIYSEAKMNRRFKLLIPKYSINSDYDKIVFKYLDFLKDYNEGVVTEADIGLDLSSRIPSTILVHYNETKGIIEWVDHIPSHVREKSF
jgi:hypothetical protein